MTVETVLQEVGREHGDVDLVVVDEPAAIVAGAPSCDLGVDAGSKRYARSASGRETVLDGTAGSGDVARLLAVYPPGRGDVLGYSGGRVVDAPFDGAQDAPLDGAQDAPFDGAQDDFEHEADEVKNGRWH